MQKEFEKSDEEGQLAETLEDQLAYINETIQESENEDSISSDNEKKLLPSSNQNPTTEMNEINIDKEESESEIERRECDCCKVIPDEIINMNCVHNICVDCTLSVS
jgi:hypothetical protein